MVFALSSVAAAKLSADVADHVSFIKEYIAVVEGVPINEEGIFEDLLFKDSSKNKTFVVYYLKNEYGHARIGVSAPKKLGNAVVRTTTRRQIRSMIRDTIKDLESFDYVIIVRKDYHLKTYEENKNELLHLFSKIRRRMNEKN
jgi:ribonuclease P protein component